MSALAEMERAIIAERQKDIHKDRRDQGLVWGKDLGPKKLVSDEVRDLIKKEFDEGKSLNRIARDLNARQVASAYGGKWYASSVKYILQQL